MIIIFVIYEYETLNSSYINYYVQKYRLKSLNSITISIKEKILDEQTCCSD